MLKTDKTADTAIKEAVRGFLGYNNSHSTKAVSPASSLYSELK
jgi:hypothetical protein